MINWYAELVFIIPVLAILVGAIVNISFAASVLYDASRLRNEEKTDPVLVPVSIWTLATLLGGPIVAGIYWILNRSPLAPDRPKNTEFDLRDYLD